MTLQLSSVLCWLLLLKLAGVDLQVCAVTREIFFFKNANPALMAADVSSGVVPAPSSQFACGSQCLASFPACMSYLHNATTGLCVQAAGPEPLVSQLEGGMGDLYVTCDTDNGFHMQHYGQAAACIAVITKKTNFTLAAAQCEQLGGYLPSVRTADKLQLLVSAMGNVSFWVGMEDLGNEGTYVWTDDGSVAFQTNGGLTAAQVAEIEMPDLWDSPREPNNYADNEDCIQVKWSETNKSLRLNDYKCFSRSRYPCEMKIRFG